jgi:hypothetical protein
VSVGSGSDRVGSGSCSTGEDDDGETQPNSRGLRGVWPSSPRMADGGGSGGVWWGPELLGHRRWTGGVEGGGGGGENAARGRERGGRGKKGGRSMVGAFYGGPVARQRERAGGPELKGGLCGELRPRDVGRRWRGGGGSGRGARHEVKAATAGRASCARRAGERGRGAVLVGGPPGKRNGVGRA